MGGGGARGGTRTSTGLTSAELEPREESGRRAGEEPEDGLLLTASPAVVSLCISEPQRRS